MFNDSKYTQWYKNIIGIATTRLLSGYKETHHIIPKSLGGDNSDSNLVHLTAKEHYIVHLLLPYMVIDPLHKKKMWGALRCMSKMIYKTHNRYVGSARFYQKAKENTDFGLGNRGRKQSAEEIQKRAFALKGHTVSAETRQKIGDANRGRIMQTRSAETRQKLSEAGKGRIVSAETKKKLSESSKLRGHKGFKGKGSRGTASAESWSKYHATISERPTDWSMKKRPQVTCPHCNKTGDISGMKRYHFDKCKSIIDFS